MIQNHIGAVVVLPDHSSGGLFPRSLGIVTQSDMLAAYRDNVSMDYPCHGVMHGVDGSLTVTPHMSRAQAAAILERNHHHHALVVDDEDHNRFAGILSSWDIASECAKDRRAWPWHRSADGRFHGFHGATHVGTSASSAVAK